MYRHSKDWVSFFLVSSSASRQSPQEETLGKEVESGLDSMFGRFFDDVLGRGVELRLAGAGHVGLSKLTAPRQLLGSSWAASVQLLCSFWQASG